MYSLTRREAVARAALLSVQNYAIELDFTCGEELFRSTSLVRFRAVEPGADSFIELQPTRLHRVVLNGHELESAETALDGNRLGLHGLAAENVLLIEAEMPYSAAGEGIMRFTDPADAEVYLYSQSFLDQAQRIFACFDQPDLKASLRLSVTAPPSWAVLANGQPVPVPQPLPRPDACRHEFAPTPPLSPYLFAVAAGRFHSVTTFHDGLPLGLHARRSLGAHLDEQAEELFEATRTAIDRYAADFDEPYPFDSCDQAFMPRFSNSGMENPGLIMYREGLLFQTPPTTAERSERRRIQLHELAHMWFGGLVSIRWWDDLWLAESFADFAACRLLDSQPGAGPWTWFAAARKVWGYDADQGPTTHPVAPAADPDQVPDAAAALPNFDGISYAKGTSVLRQLAVKLGPGEFLRATRRYLRTHRHGNAELADFVAVFEAEAGRPLEQWARQWLRTSGVDTVSVHADHRDPGRITLRLDGSRPHRISVGGFGTANAVPSATADSTLTLIAADTVELTPESPMAVIPVDLLNRAQFVLPNHDDTSYCKVRLDSASWSTVTRRLGRIDDPVARAVLWTMARDMVRDAEFDPAQYLELALSHLPAELDPATFEAALSFARTQVVDRFLDPCLRPEALRSLSRMCLGLLEDGGSGPERRLACVRALISSTDEPELIEDWLAHDLCPYLDRIQPLGRELRWRIVRRLGVLDAIDEKVIAEREAADRTLSGAADAAEARTCLPRSEAKRAAWEAVFEDPETTPDLIAAYGRGLWQPGHEDLTAKYVLEYFDATARLTERRGPAIGAAVARHVFPVNAVDRAVLEAGYAALTRPVPPVVHRRLAAHLDDLHRVLRSREAYAAQVDA